MVKRKEQEELERQVLAQNPELKDQKGKSSNETRKKRPLENSKPGTETEDIEGQPEMAVTSAIAGGGNMKHNVKKTNKKQADLDENAADDEDNELEGDQEEKESEEESEGEKEE